MIFTPLSIVVVLLAGALAVPAPGTGALVGYCNTSVDCNANECCVSFNRDSVVDLSPDLKRLVRGKCEPLGGQGAVCYVSIGPNPPGLPDRYYYACPCIKGAFCSKNAPSLPRVGGPGNQYPNNSVQHKCSHQTRVNKTGITASSSSS